MPTKVFFSIFILFACISRLLMGDMIYQFASQSDKTDNKILIEILINESFNNKVSLIKGLGVREDFYIEDILIFLSIPGKKRYQNEYLIRLILKSIFNVSLPRQEIQLRIQVNLQAVSYLFNHLGQFQCPGLKSQIIQLFSFFPAFKYESIIMNELRKLSKKSSNHHIITDPDIKIELISILDLLETSRNKAFIEPLLILLQNNRDQTITSKIKTVLKKLVLHK